MAGWLRSRRRKRLSETPLPGSQRELIERNVPVYRSLGELQKRELEGHIQVFLAEKRFEGCGGLEVTGEMRLTIAAQACLLLLGRETGYFPGMETIFVYPERFMVRDTSIFEDGTVREEDDELTGESWMYGPVVLAWDEVLVSASGPGDGYNVVLHEFAHQLDAQTGEQNGMPPIRDAGLRERWREVMEKEYARLGREVARGLPTLIDEYALESPAEFFAVVTEVFFQRPRALRRRHPDLYGIMSRYYRYDPAA